MRRKDLGKQGEKLAVKLLKRNKYKVLEKNFCSKFGEIDIVAIDPSTSSGQNTLVFVEVKTRWSKKFGLPEEAIAPWKIKRIIRTGQYYKSLHPELPEAMRFDVVAIELSPSGEIGEIRIVKNITG